MPATRRASQRCVDATPRCTVESTLGDPANTATLGESVAQCALCHRPDVPSLFIAVASDFSRAGGKKTPTRRLG
jgi:hypothetical protein